MTFYMYSAIPLSTGFKEQDKGGAMFAVLDKLFRNQDGATAIEYAFIASLVSVVAFAFIANIGTSVSASFESVANSL